MAVSVSAQHVVARPTGGAGSVSGAVTGPDGSPSVRTVRLYERYSGRLIRETSSAADGTYTIGDLRVGLVVDVRIMDDDTGTVYNDLVHSGVVVA